MSLLRVLSLAGGVLVLGCGGAWAQATDGTAPALEPPRSSGPAAEAGAPTPEPPLAEPPLTGPEIQDPAVRIPQAPPAPLAEGPKGKPTAPGARWIGGFWDYDASQKRYVWVAGTWQVPPPGKVWVSGSWQHDDRGWYRIPGSWGEKRGGSSDWRRMGPPADRPEEAIGAAPAPGSFYVPGTHVPDGDRVAWRPGFWAASQPGWEWIPARWVRLSDGWDYREGYWSRGNQGQGQGLPFAGRGPRPAADDRHVVARPNPEPTARPDADGPTDLEAIPDQDVQRAGADPAGEPPLDARPEPTPRALAERPAGPPAPTDPRVVVPAPVVIRPGLPIPYWDGRRLVVPPTRFGAGVVVDTPGPGNPSPFPAVGILPPRGSGRGIPPGGVFGGRVRGMLDRVLP